MSNERDLRPHHGLCLGFFEGKGYSGEFSQNMASMLADLTPDSPIRLADGHDTLCAHCPNRFAPCPNAADYDRRVLELCGLKPGQALTWGAFRSAVVRCVLAPGKLSAVCGNCQWAEICRKKDQNTAY